MIPAAGVRRRLTAFFIIVTALAVTLALLSKTGDWLSVSDPAPVRLDVIFTFAGENQRITYSRELVQRFPAARWVLSDYLHQYSRILSREKFDMSKVAVLDTCPSTRSEVSGLADWLAGDTAGSAIGLVSNPFHMRRIKFMVNDRVRGAAGCHYQFYYLPVPVERYGWTTGAVHRWWKSKTLRTWTFSEIGKLIAYWLSS